MKAQALYSIIFLFTACHNETPRVDFYSYTKRWDLWRVPILEPYEIVSPTNDSSWFFIIKKPNIHHKDYYNDNNKFELHLSGIDSIGVKNSLIVLKSKKHYWPRLSGEYKTTLIVNTKSGEQFIYSNKHHTKELSDKLHELKIEDTKLYRFTAIKDNFQSTQTLPADWK